MSFPATDLVNPFPPTRVVFVSLQRHASSELDTTNEECRCGLIQWEPISGLWVEVQQIGDRPITQHVVIECHTVIAEIPQCLTLHKSVDWQCRVRLGIQRFAVVERLLRKVLKDPGAIAVKCVRGSIGALPPLLGHIDLSPRDLSGSGAVGQAGQTEEVPSHGSSRM